MEYYIVSSVRLTRFLYSLGFEKESYFKDGKEKWRFEKSEKLLEAVQFFRTFRKENFKSNEN